MMRDWKIIGYRWTYTQYPGVTYSRDIPGLTVVVWNVGVDVVTNEQLYDVITVYLAGVAKRRAAGVIASVHVGAP